MSRRLVDEMRATVMHIADGRVQSPFNLNETGETMAYCGRWFADVFDPDGPEQFCAQCEKAMVVHLGPLPDEDRR